MGLSASQKGTQKVEPVARQSFIPCSIRNIPSAACPETLRTQP
jgi:hypothetical protein